MFLTINYLAEEKQATHNYTFQMRKGILTLDPETTIPGYILPNTPIIELMRVIQTNIVYGNFIPR